jgi:hypothetical protein
MTFLYADALASHTVSDVALIDRASRTNRWSGGYGIVAPFGGLELSQHANS